MSGLYAWMRRNPRVVDGALALLLIVPGGGIPKLGVRWWLPGIPFVLGMVVPVFRRDHPVGAFTAVVICGALQVPLLRRPIGSDLAVLEVGAIGRTALGISVKPMAAVAIALGAALGVTFGVVMVHGFILSTAGQGVLSIPYAKIALYALIGACAALAAAVPPARRAAGTSVVTAMAEA